MQSCSEPWWSDSQEQHRAIIHDLQEVLSNKSVNLTLALLSSSLCLKWPAYSSSCPEPFNSWGPNCPLCEAFWDGSRLSLAYCVSFTAPRAGLEPFFVWALQGVEGQAPKQYRAGQGLQPWRPCQWVLLHPHSTKSLKTGSEISCPEPSLAFLADQQAEQHHCAYMRESLFPSSGTDYRWL